MKGRRGKNKPRVRRMFARVKKTLYTFRDGRIRVTVKPGGNLLGVRPLESLVQE